MFGKAVWDSFSHRRSGVLACLIVGAVVDRITCHASCNDRACNEHAFFEL